MTISLEDTLRASFDQDMELYFCCHLDDNGQITESEDDLPEWLDTLIIDDHSSIVQLTDWINERTERGVSTSMLVQSIKQGDDTCHTVDLTKIW